MSRNCVCSAPLRSDGGKNCFYCGKPVVHSIIENTVNFDGVIVADGVTPEQFQNIWSQFHNRIPHGPGMEAVKFAADELGFAIRWFFYILKNKDNHGHRWSSYSEWRNCVERWTFKEAYAGIHRYPHIVEFISDTLDGVHYLLFRWFKVSMSLEQRQGIRKAFAFLVKGNSSIVRKDDDVSGWLSVETLIGTLIGTVAGVIITRWWVGGW